MVDLSSGFYKKLTVCLIACMMLVQVPGKAAPIAIAEIIRQGVKRVIIAVDLQIQRMQNETIWLQNAQKVIENNMAKLRLEEISDWSSKQKELYADYYDGLWKVKSVIAQFQRVKETAALQGRILEEYQRTWKIITVDGNFSPEEMKRMQLVYTGMLEESIRHIDHLVTLVGQYRNSMTDAERLERIHLIEGKVKEHYLHMVKFNRTNLQINNQRAALRKDLYMLQNTLK